MHQKTQDLISATKKLQEIYLSKNKDQLKNFSSSSFDDIFNFILDGKNNIEENYHFVINNFQDNPLELMKSLGRPLFTRIMSVDNSNIVKIGATLINLQKSYNETYKDTIDPIVHLISYVSDIKELLKN
jgi:hypothetical protein